MPLPQLRPPSLLHLLGERLGIGVPPLALVKATEVAEAGEERPGSCSIRAVPSRHDGPEELHHEILGEI